MARGLCASGVLGAGAAACPLLAGAAFAFAGALLALGAALELGPVLMLAWGSAA